MKARGFLLFSFAFSCALSSSDIGFPSQLAESKIVKASRYAPPETSAVGVVTATSATDHDLKKRAIGDVKQKETGRSLSNVQNLLPARQEDQDLNKRNRMGFTGMRGKKKDLTGEISSDDFEEPRCCDVTQENKRGFSRNYKELFGGKRTPFAFHGMRGKKSKDDEETFWFDPESEFETRRYIDEKDVVGPDYLDPALERKDDDIFEDGDFVVMNKRSPYSFQGIAGKKTGSYDLKRAMGFLGMRGKKALEIWNSDVYKRAPQSAFFGMKGKKAQSGFFGMRGKKPFSASSNYNFQENALRPLEKKMAEMDELLGNDHRENSFSDHLEENAPSKMRSRRGSSWEYNDKKTKNAFFGVKGKKSTAESSMPNFVFAED